LANLLAGLTRACARHALPVVLLGLLLAAGGAVASARYLGVTTDTDKLFSNSLPWKQHQAELDHAFPQFADLLVVVIDAAIPEEAEATATALARTLSADTQHFTFVRRPDASPFFDKNGLLFLDKPELETLLNQTIDAQPFIGQLVADPSARGLFSALSLVAMGVEHGQADLGSFGTALDGFHTTLAQALQGDAQPLSWQKLLGGGLSDKAGPYHFVLAQARLDYGALQPGGAATAAIRAAAAQLPFVTSGQAHVRITGSVALADEEFASVAEGALTGLLISFALVTLWLFLAVHSWRLVLPIVFTLLLGLVLTSGFAALAVGTLNLISVAFAILFVGIAVDFAIQFSVRLREHQIHEPSLADAIATTGRSTGVQILVAALATAAGFLAFVPTDFLGVAELGLIAGVGMLIAFACTLTFLPACLSLFRPKPAKAEVGFRWAGRLDLKLARARWPILIASALIAAGGAIAVPHLTFDGDPLHTKNPNTEAMRTLASLAANPLTSPYTAEFLAPDLAQAEASVPKLAALPLVDSVMTLASYIPDNQPDKLALIADAAGILAPTLTAPSTAAPVTPADLRLAVSGAADQLNPVLTKIPATSPLALVTHDLDRLRTAPDATLMAMNEALTRFLPLQLDHLRTALSAGPITAASIPPDIANDWRLPDGRARVQATAKTSLPNGAPLGSAGLHQFVTQVQSVAPQASGSAVSIVASADTIIAAFRTAAIGALVAIAVILLVVLRRLLDAALVLAPLLLSALLTALLAVLIPLPLNFANIIALPLLLGVGVSFNIYFVMNWRGGETRPLGSATARAVLFSALTTGTAFSSLALSAHPGTASMGTLLLVSLACTLIATLVFVPSLLAALTRP
jgi:hopanoid biosynthesis associated RND transporter like protein HpnN